MAKRFLIITSFFILLIIFSMHGSTGLIKKNQIQSTYAEFNSEESCQYLELSPDFGKIPLYFILNQGQAHEKALYYAKARDYTLWLTRGGLVFDSARTQEEAETLGKRIGMPRYERNVSRMFFVGADQDVAVAAKAEAEYKVHYFIGNDKSQWRTDIPTSEAVVYKGVYKNIDLSIYGVERQIEYDWVVKPGADVTDIRVKYQGVKETRIDGDGNLVIATKFGELMHQRPVGYQEIEGKRVAVEVAFKQVGENMYGFEPVEYDRGHVLTIDPAVLVYSTYLGGNGSDSCSGIAVDSSGYAYVTGITRSSNFPLEDELDSTAGALATAFVTKFAVNGSSLIFSTYLGNANYAEGADIKLGINAGVIITGCVIGQGFPTTDGAYQANSNGGYDAFLTCLSTDGSLINYSTYFGGTKNDFARGLSRVENYLTGNPPFYLTVDRFYITGSTHSLNFPLVNARNTVIGGEEDAFVAKWTALSAIPPLVNLEYSTFLGGSRVDQGYGIDQDDGYAYVTGTTASPHFPLVYGPSGLKGYTDAFVTKFSQDGSKLEYSCFIGGNGYEDGFAIAVGADGAAYVTGRTTSSDFPAKNSFDNSLNGGEDAFVTKVILITQELSPGNIDRHIEFPFSTYLGGNHFEQGYGIALDSVENIYITGKTQSSNFPCISSYDNSLGGVSDAFVSIVKLFNSTAFGVLFSTYLGGGGEDKGLAITLDDNNIMYVAGSTGSSNFPIVNPFQGTKAASEDGFVTKMNFTITKNDFNGDGQGDILWRHYGSGANALWYVNSFIVYTGLTEVNAVPMSIDRSREPIQVYKDAREVGEVLFKDERVYHDVMEVSIPHEQIVEKDVYWDTIEAGKALNRPGEEGIFGDLQELMKLGYPITGVQTISIMGTAFLTTISDLNWKIAGTGDFNRDGNVDILWRNYANGKNALWYMEGSTILGTAYLITITDVNWEIAGTGDFNRDGNVDILWRHYGTGGNAVWYMNKSMLIGAVYLTSIADTNWVIEATGDFNKDGSVDIVWRHYGTGANVIWYMNGTAIFAFVHLATVADTNWRIEGAGDFSGEGNIDILWRHYGSGANVSWIMSGSTIVEFAFLTTITDVNWNIENH